MRVARLDLPSAPRDGDVDVRHTQGGESGADALRSRGRRPGGVDDDEFSGDERSRRVVVSITEEHVHRVREGGFVREPGDEQRPRLGHALVTSARVARVFGAHAGSPRLGIGRWRRRSEGELRGVPGVRRAEDAAREILVVGARRGGDVRDDVEALGAQPAEPRRGDRVIRDGSEKGDGLRVVRPSRRPGGYARVVDSVVPGSIPALVVAVVFPVVVSTVDVAEHAPDRERRRAGFPPPELVGLVVVVVFWRRGDVGEEGGAIGAEVEGPRGGPPAPRAAAARGAYEARRGQVAVQRIQRTPSRRIDPRRSVAQRRTLRGCEIGD
mmetsp:Transcript_4731/g.21162  ORF Transcript_4731/g.21162 Transcript_4731/m.21162 type:complete len:325 (+) Transcript_4731:3513-4487(+)